MQKHALITGGNKGIGLETTKRFLDSGFSVTVVARDFSSFPLSGREGVREAPFDLSALEKIPALIESLPPVDVLVNNAGVMFSLPYDQYPQDKVQTALRLNLEVPVALIRECAKGMEQKGQGRIVNTASVAGQTGHPDVWYGITKAGVINATKSFAKILGPKGIVVNAVAPGPTETDMLDTIPAERKEAFLKMVILQRFAKPGEVAAAIHWLGVECPEYINGFCIDVNNGALPR